MTAQKQKAVWVLHNNSNSANNSNQHNNNNASRLHKLQMESTEN